MNSTEKQRLQSLISQLCDGDIDSGDLTILSSIMDNNDEAIREYLSYTSLHLALEHRLRAGNTAGEVGADVQTASRARVTNARQAPGSRFIQSRWVWRAAAFAVAASVLSAAVFLLRGGDASDQFIARIVQKIDCDWGEERWGTLQSSQLEAGREIRLERGVMVLEFGDGAEVTLEAPVHYKIIGRGRSELSFGKLSAFVPERGRGFAVQIPSGEVVDLGTNFGVMVDENGDSETHVFSGHVLLRSDTSGQGQKMREWELTANEAMSVSPTDKTIKRFAARRASFLQLAGVKNPVPAVESPLITIPADSELVLWLEASRKLQLDENNHVVSWGDLAGREPDQSSNAWQVDRQRRPLWLTPSHQTRPTVRFNGSAYLVTPPLASGNAITTVCVFRGQARDLTSQLGQLLNLNGPPTLILAHSKENQLVGTIVSRSGDHAAGTRLASSLPNTDSPVVGIYSYDPSQSRSSLYINGQLVSETDAPYGLVVNSPKYIGASNFNDSFFVGDMYEVLVFNSALATDQAVMVASELMEKYDIADLDPEPRVLSGIMPDDDKIDKAKDAKKNESN